jgi:hypothetical protein
MLQPPQRLLDFPEYYENEPPPWYFRWRKCINFQCNFSECQCPFATTKQFPRFIVGSVPSNNSDFNNMSTITGVTSVNFWFGKLLVICFEFFIRKFLKNIFINATLMYFLSFCHEFCRRQICKYSGRTITQNGSPLFYPELRHSESR